MKHILTIDQGTTSTRALIFNETFQIKGQAAQEFTQSFPQSGWVEHDPLEIWQTVVDTGRLALLHAGLDGRDITAIGITNQRETTVVWERSTGKPIHPAIVWQDRRTADDCAKLDEQTITARTGLLPDPYFSATKIAWILRHVEGAQKRAEEGHLCFGTIDSYLIWRLTKGQSHKTDATNAARTMLYDIHRGEWSRELCDMFNIPMAMLPEVCDCAADFGTTGVDIFGARLPILGVAGDQQAAAMGQGCFTRGMVKSTYGTGCFALLNTGSRAVASNNRLLTTIAYRLDGQVSYALEGSIFMAGAVVQWLRDGLQMIGEAGETVALAESARTDSRVVIVPAFTGLGAPYWAAGARGAVYGLTRDTGRAELARAALQAVGFQTRDLVAAMRADMGDDAGSGAGSGDNILRVDGGMSANGYAMQFLSDILGAKVDRPRVLESTALGAAWLAGMRAGIYPEQAGFAGLWQCERQFTPTMEADDRAKRLADWDRAVQATLSFSC